MSASSANASRTDFRPFLASVNVTVRDTLSLPALCLNELSGVGIHVT